jgi:uncharacterized protein
VRAITLGVTRASGSAAPAGPEPWIFAGALSPDDALAVIDGWMNAGPVTMLEPTERHWGIFKELVGAAGVAGNLTSDAHLAALAIEHGATLCSTDRDFGRFTGLRWRNPLAAVRGRRR